MRQVADLRICFKDCGPDQRKGRVRKSMKRKKHILVVDDEPDILQMMEYHLTKEDFHVTCVTTGEEAIEAAINHPPDLVILDIMLPGINGLDVFKRLYNEPNTKQVPVVFLSAKSDELDIIIGLELGACDYVTKPFSLKVLISRIKVILERQIHKKIEQSVPDTIKIRNLEIFPGKQKVFFKGKTVRLTHAEFRILELLSRKPGWVFSRMNIMESIHNLGDAVTDRCIDVHIYALRKKLGPGKDYIETVHHAGYRLVD